MALPDGKPINEEDEFDGLQPLDLNAIEAAPVDDDFEVEITDDEAAPAVEAKAAPDEATEQNAGAEAEETDDPEFKSFTPNIQKRIQREIRIRRKAEEAANVAVEQRRQVLEEKTRVESEAEQLRVANVGMQRNYADVLIHAFGKEMDIKQRDLKAARDNSDFDAEQKIQTELDDLRFKQNQIKDMRSRIPDEPERPAAQPQAQAQAQAQPQRPPVNPRATKWLTDNLSWFNHARFKPHRSFALSVDAELVAEGYDQKSEEYYKELDKRIDEAFPTLRRKKNTSSTTARTAGVSEAPMSKNRGGKVVLRQSDLETMRKFGLDPTNKQHLREFARQMQSES